MCYSAAVRLVASLLVALAAGSGAALACSTSSSGPPPPCNVKYDCPAGQTCWPVDDEGTRFACLTSGSAGPGELCANQGGTPSCGDGLLCVLVAMDGGSACLSHCDPNASATGCPAGDPCVTGATKAHVTYGVCLPLPPDAG